MKTSYRELDYESGRAIQTLRGKICLTQVGLGEYLGVSARTVREWEVGGNYPRAENLKALIALAIKSQVFSKGSEAEEIRALWKTTRQRWLLDEDWLSALLSPPSSQPSHVEPEINLTSDPTQTETPLSTKGDSKLRPGIDTNLHSDEQSSRVAEIESSGSEDSVNISSVETSWHDKKRVRRKRLLISLIALVILTITASAGTFFFYARGHATDQTYLGYLSGHGTLAFFDHAS